MGGVIPCSIFLMYQKYNRISIIGYANSNGTDVRYIAKLDIIIKLTELSAVITVL